MLKMCSVRNEQRQSKLTCFSWPLLRGHEHMLTLKLNQTKKAKIIQISTAITKGECLTRDVALKGNVGRRLCRIKSSELAAVYRQSYISLRHHRHCLQLPYCPPLWISTITSPSKVPNVWARESNSKLLGQRIRCHSVNLNGSIWGLGFCNRN